MRTTTININFIDTQTYQIISLEIEIPTAEGIDELLGSTLVSVLVFGLPVAPPTTLAAEWRGEGEDWKCCGSLVRL